VKTKGERELNKYEGKYITKRKIDVK